MKAKCEILRHLRAPDDLGVLGHYFGRRRTGEQVELDYTADSGECDGGSWLNGHVHCIAV